MASTTTHAMSTRSAKKPAAINVDFSNKASQSTLLFTKLPAEVRNIIFELVSDGFTMRYTRRSRLRTKKGHSGKPSPPAYLLTCKEVYLESISMLYANAHFDFATLAGWREWSAKVDKNKTSLAKKIQIRGRMTIEAYVAKYGHSPDEGVDDSIAVAAKAKPSAGK